MNYLESILSIIKSESSSVKHKKSALWIIAKIVKLDRIRILNIKYKILDLINTTFTSTNDFGLRGCIIYIFSYLSSNINVKNEIIKYGWTFFKNSDIAFYKLDSEFHKESIKVSVVTGENVISKYVNLNSTNEEFYNQFCLLLNTITYKQAYSKLREQFKINPKSFINPRLIIRVLDLLCNYRFQQQLRQFIFSSIENGLNNVVVMKEINKILKSLGNEYI
jgi:hypothetical protein